MLELLPDHAVQEYLERSWNHSEELKQLFREELSLLANASPGQGFPPAPLDQGWRQQDWDQYWDELLQESTASELVEVPAPTMDG